MTATVPLWGKMADLYSKKLLIQFSLGLFVVGSLIAGFTPNVEVLLLSRVVQGIGAGGMTALATIVMAAMIPPRELGRYSGIFGAVFGVGTDRRPADRWRARRHVVARLALVLPDRRPVQLVSIALLQRTLHLPVVRRKAKIDWLGALLITSGVSTLLIWSSLAGQQVRLGLRLDGR